MSVSPDPYSGLCVVWGRSGKAKIIPVSRGMKEFQRVFLLSGEARTATMLEGRRNHLDEAYQQPAVSAMADAAFQFRPLDSQARR